MPHTFLAALVAIGVTADVQAPRLSSLRLPGGAPVGMDYLAYDVHSGLLFVPASNTGKLDVIDTRTGKLRSVDGWPTAQRDDRVAGITAATTGAGYAYVGNRADSKVCAVEIETLARRGCVTLPSTPDGVFYVAPTHEVWVTTPRDNSLQVLSLRDPAASPSILTPRTCSSPVSPRVCGSSARTARSWRAWRPGPASTTSIGSLPGTWSTSPARRRGSSRSRRQGPRERFPWSRSHRRCLEDAA